MMVHLLLLLSYTVQAVGAQMTLSPETLTVLRGKEARFTCSTPNPEWTVMVWLLNGQAALTISKEHGVLAPNNTNMTAEKSPKSRGDSWVFILKSTERNNNGQVTCDLQNIDRRTAKLNVQEAGSVKVFGDDELAFKGQSVRFECQAAGWYPKPILYWQVNERKVSQSEYNISSKESGKSLFTVSSNLSVTAAKSSHVDCLASMSALPTPLKSSVRLTVVAEVLQEGDDCTIPLAVTGSLAALLLLLLLCICTVLCYRQRRQAKPNPQEATWFDQPEVGKRSVSEVTTGTVNQGYYSEDPTDADHYNEMIMETHSRMDFVSFHTAPDVVHCSNLSQNESQEEEEEENAKTIKRITTV